MTIRCRWGKAGADFTEDEAASMSTDQSGSSLTGNIKDFFSRTLLGGGGGGGRGAEMGGSGGGYGGGGRSGAMSPMEAIGEDDGTPGGARRHDGDGAPGRAESGSPAFGGSPGRHSQDLNEADWEGAVADYYPDAQAVGTLNIHDRGDDDDEGPGVGVGRSGGGAAVIYTARRTSQDGAPPSPSQPTLPVATAAGAAVAVTAGVASVGGPSPPVSPVEVSPSGAAAAG